MNMADTSLRFKMGIHRLPKGRAFRGDIGLAIAVIILCSVSTLPATTGTRPINQSRVTWHRLKASPANESLSEEARKSKKKSSPTYLLRAPEGETSFQIPETDRRIYFGCLPVHPPGPASVGPKLCV
jgi:hypothetical protein